MDEFINSKIEHPPFLNEEFYLIIKHTRRIFI